MKPVQRFVVVAGFNNNGAATLVFMWLVITALMRKFITHVNLRVRSLVKRPFLLLSICHQ